MLTNVCKLLFAETRVEENDAVVHEEGIASVLVAVLRLAQWADGDDTAQEECVVLSSLLFMFIRLRVLMLTGGGRRF